MLNKLEGSKELFKQDSLSESKFLFSVFNYSLFEEEFLRKRMKQVEKEKSMNVDLKFIDNVAYCCILAPGTTKEDFSITLKYKNKQNDQLMLHVVLEKAPVGDYYDWYDYNKEDQWEIVLPQNAVKNRITAKCENGVLTIEIPLADFVDEKIEIK